ncbi:MAG: DNA-binding protein [Bacteroidetes bacterium]|nr:MAG: DNA-binding protein [Bacteroidota bacterium]
MRIRLILSILVLSIAFTTKAQVINPEDAARHIGDSLTVCGEIFTARYFESSNNKPTLLNMGAAYPDNPITIVIFEDVRTKLNFKPEEKWVHKDLCITGKIELYKGKPEIVVHDPSQIKEK